MKGPFPNSDARYARRLKKKTGQPHFTSGPNTLSRIKFRTNNSWQDSVLKHGSDQCASGGNRAIFWFSTKVSNPKDYRILCNCRKRLTSNLDLESKFFLKNRYLRIDELEEYTKNWHSVHVGKRPSDDWATIGIIQRVHHRADFCAAKITNMRELLFSPFCSWSRP